MPNKNIKESQKISYKVNPNISNYNIVMKRDRP